MYISVLCQHKTYHCENDPHSFFPYHMSLSQTRQIQDCNILPGGFMVNSNYCTLMNHHTVKTRGLMQLSLAMALKEEYFECLTEGLSSKYSVDLGVGK